jgi:hypothetical protein
MSMTSKKPADLNPAMKPDISGGSSKAAGLSREIQTKIGHQLRAMYDDIVQEGVPDRFAELLRKLEKPEG